MKRSGSGKTASASGTVLPLFPTYLFVRINSRERVKVLQSPGVLQIVGNGKEAVPLPDSEVELLRCGLSGQQIRTVIASSCWGEGSHQGGMMQGIQGTLVRKTNSIRFVLSLGLINQHAAMEVIRDAEPAPA